ncbi:hypothetical protein MMC10_009274 [Thelotrema lepadinum]|nr:hypothetical protein [Thelotrema lepadinum]
MYLLPLLSLLALLPSTLSQASSPSDLDLRSLSSSLHTAASNYLTARSTNLGAREAAEAYLTVRSALAEAISSVSAQPDIGSQMSQSRRRGLYLSNNDISTDPMARRAAPVTGTGREVDSSIPTPPGASNAKGPTQPGGKMGNPGPAAGGKTGKSQAAAGGGKGGSPGGSPGVMTQKEANRDNAHLASIGSNLAVEPPTPAQQRLMAAA